MASLWKEDKKAYQREWMRKARATNPEYRKKDLENAKRWQEENKERNSYGVYKRGASRRNYDFDLTEEDFNALITGDCNYCGTPPNPLNGVDRLNNEIGYNIDNCVPCCFNCNRAKGTLTIEQFKELIIKIYNRIIK